ncbi:MAG: ATP-grasp domain-containing protein [Chloroflexi bacterium]|nr:ATP-grasp domain-containing protein [Chloroflexota bacterium]
MESQSQHTHRSCSQVLVLREPDSIWTFEARPSILAHVGELHEALTNAGYSVTPIEIESAADLPRALASFHPCECVVFNWFEGFEPEARDGIEVTQQLDAMDFTYTGSGVLAWQNAQDKIRAKRLMRAHAIPTPRWQALCEENLDDWSIYPAIVKVANDHGSEHLTFDSVVYDRNGLANRLGELERIGVSSLMVAEYIEGDEFTVALWGNGTLYALPLIRVDFSALAPGLPHIRTFDAKWDTDSEVYHAIKLESASGLSPEIQGRVERAARAAYRAFGLRDYGRVDIRLRDGTPFVIDVNANPDITSEGSFFAAARIGGYNYSGMLDRIVQLAAERR